MEFDPNIVSNIRKLISLASAYSLTIVLDPKGERDEVPPPLDEKHGLDLEPALVHAPLAEHPVKSNLNNSENLGAGQTVYGQMGICRNEQ